MLQNGKTAEELATELGHTEVAALIRVSTEYYLNPLGPTVSMHACMPILAVVYCKGILGRSKGKYTYPLL